MIFTSFENLTYSKYTNTQQSKWIRIMYTGKLNWKITPIKIWKKLKEKNMETT